MELTECRSTLQRKISEILVQKYDPDDPILECGPAPLSIIKHRADDVLSLAHEKLHAFPYREVPECWRRLYTDAALWKILALESDDWLSDVVKLLDMAIILTGAPRRYEAIQSLFHWLQQVSQPKIDRYEYIEPTQVSARPAEEEEASGFRKRRKIEHAISVSFPQARISQLELLEPMERLSIASLPAFQLRINQDHDRNNKQGPVPFIITGALVPWPAISEEDRKWSNPQHLLARTLGGRRLVPVELGRSYTDEDWGQKIMPFGEFLVSHMLQDPQTSLLERKTGYLAQHDLFAQIPELRADIAIPDFCYATVPEPQRAEKSDDGSREEADGDDDALDRNIMLNVWIGPAHTISPLHTDPHHNILAQVFGSKYVRLYPPCQTENLYPRSKEGDVDMSNTSEVDVDMAMKVLEGRSLEPACNDLNRQAAPTDQAIEKEVFARTFPKFADANYVEGILGQGECLFIPRGWWHYVRSLSPSCSVSFWWD
ncbi:uncharacterized protein PV09_01434 [Verruconis gallopava]|uniref:JmjC domain-containing protein n=1 Tax=Verruconis gallopava TaxID=253628 RepID=A0A0D1XXI2_9PEZI|nr:uncharacterized protein PV09_01434 [Verruconis gallopava]KIW07466.1 hypothetical protein PV09_01434 [Verruconis gallopava]